VELVFGMGDYDKIIRIPTTNLQIFYEFTNTDLLLLRIYKSFTLRLPGHSTGFARGGQIYPRMLRGKYFLLGVFGQFSFLNVLGWGGICEIFFALLGTCLRVSWGKYRIDF